MIPPLVVFVPLVAIVENVVVEEGVKDACDEHPDNPLFKFATIVAVLVLGLLHEILNAFLVFFISIKLVSVAGSRSQFKQSGAKQDASTGISKEIRTTITIVCTTLLKILIFLPMCIVEIIYNFDAILPIDESSLTKEEQAQKLLYRSKVSYFDEFFEEFILLAHVINFFVYLVSVPSFRATVCNLFGATYRVKGSSRGSEIISNRTF